LANLPQHIKEGFSSLGLPEKLRARLMEPFTPTEEFRGFFPPDDPRFWQAVENVMRFERGSRGTRYEDLNTRELFKVALAQCGVAEVPKEWLAAAVHVVLCLQRIHQYADSITDGLSRDLHQKYFGGKSILDKRHSRFVSAEPIPEVIIEAVSYGLITEPWVAREIAQLQVPRLDPLAPTAQRQHAAELCQQIGAVFIGQGSGRYRLPNEARTAIVAACKKWLPVCEALNKAFKTLWEESEYQTQEVFRKEARGRLAEKLGIPVRDVQAIEESLKNPSRRGSKKSTPTQAMCRMVARLHLVGSKTVEKIWGEYVRSHPEWGKKRKTPTP
jgi:hypothetical protein